MRNAGNDTDLYYGPGVHWERSEEVVRDLEAFMKEVRPARWSFVTDQTVGTE
jgi:hypothetical protein